MAAVPQKPVRPSHSFCGWGNGEARKVRLGYLWLLSYYNWEARGMEVGIKEGVISECELTTGAGAFAHCLAEDAKNRERDCSSEILVLKFSHS